jgi:hypothetical protein
MSSKFAKFATGIAVAAVMGVGTGLAPTAAVRAANAADDCLTEPSGPTTQGKHWYYHIERGTGRHCWYQRGQDDTGASPTAQDQSAATSDDAPSTPPAKSQVISARDQTPPTKPVARKAETLPTRSIADARAEWSAQPKADDNGNAPAAAPATPAAPQTAANASVFPDPRTVLPAKPAAEPSLTTSSDADTSQDDTTASVAAAPAPSPAPSTQAGPLGNRHLGSIPTLLLVAFGALALAGLTGHTVYRLASVGRRVRPEDRWNRNVKLQGAPASRPRPIPIRPEPIEETFQDHFEDDIAPEEFADAEPEQIVRKPVERESIEDVRFEPHADLSHPEPQTDDAHHRRVQIEAHLAQLTRQLRADLKAAASAEMR